MISQTLLIVLLFFFLLGGTFCIGDVFGEIFNILAEESSDILVRKKRIIDKTENGNKPVAIENVPYIVNVLENRIPNCAASILSPNIVITAAHCVEDNSNYTILSGSSFINRGNRHRVTKIQFHPERLKKGDENDLALLTIFPPIDLVHSPNREISLYNGDIPPNTYGTISGWGCTHVKW